MRLVLVLTMALAAPAFAQDRPVTTPLRDVDVVYRSSASGKTLEQRSRFRAADQMLRLDTPTPGLYMIVNQRAHTVAMVSDPDRGVVDMPFQGTAVPGGLVGGQAFTRRGADEVAGLPCTEWETLDNLGQTILACFTADGVMLRARKGAQVLVAATRVAYGPHDPAVFTVPQAYSHVTGRGSR